ncbi:probable cytochrome P450 6a14 [Culex pipiens pallens]|uniref:probable cytochrome P450 6a14 n=1 Tax=Culex pipiens pallens TaxID=42434 RepID=UPI001953AA2B|nr:probable cytochrome P450 6a14 [Culex pipiens pallens]
MYIELLILVVTLLVLGVVFLRQKYTYWKRQNVPFIEPKFPYGNFQEANQISTADISSKQYHSMKTSGRFFGMYFFFEPLVMLTDLDLIKTMLVKDFNFFPDRGIYYNEKDDPLSAHMFAIEGKKWRSLRTRLTPTFSSGKMKMMFPILKAVGDTYSDYVAKMIGSGAELEVKDAVARFTTDVIGNCAFGIDCNSFAEPNNEFREFGVKIINEPISAGIMRIFWKLFPELGNLLGIKALNVSATTFFRRLVADTIDYRQKSTVDRKDFMSMLVELKNKGDLTLDEAAAQSLVFFVAGFETSSSNQAYCLYELALNPYCQEKARESVLKAIEKHGGLNYEAVNDMLYLDQCINESLRLYPSVPVLERKTFQSYKIPDSDVTIPKGMKIHIPVFAIQRDEQYYPEPLKFNPDRFHPSEVAKRHSSTFLPFGDGQRACIGLRFGMLQSRMGLAAMLSKFRFSISERTVVPLEYSVQAPILQPKSDLVLKVEPL